MKNRSFKFIFNFIIKQSPNFKIWGLILFLILIYSGAGRLLPVLFGRSIDLGLLANNLSTFKTYCFIFVFVGITRTASGFILNYFIYKESNNISFNLRRNLYNHILKLKINFFDKNPSGKTLTRVTNDTKSFQGLLGEGVVGIIISIFELFTIMISLFVISIPLAAIILLLAPLVLGFGIYLTVKIQKYYFEMKEYLSELNTFLADSLNGYTIIKSYNQFNQKSEHFYKISKNYLNKNLKISYLHALLWPQIEFFQLLASIVCFSVGIYLIEQNLLEVGSLVAFILLIQSFFHPLRFILERLNQFQNGYTSSKRIAAILEEPEEENTNKNILPSHFSPTVNFNNLHFSYEKTNPVIKNLNYTVKPYKITGVIGRTGSGKTTLISLIQRLYLPTSGKIFIDNHDITNLDLFDLRKNVCVVRQEDFIFSGSLAENISLLPKKEINYTLAQEALEFAEISKPLDFHVSFSGGNLSPGERQLLSFARAYYLSPKILIFDEATSFIDEKTEKILQEKIKTLFQNKTVIIIAHKTTTIDMCDEILELK